VRGTTEVFGAILDENIDVARDDFVLRIVVEGRREVLQIQLTPKIFETFLNQIIVVEL
jgi:hypothetical protein